MTVEKPQVATAIDFVQEPGSISVRFRCSVCGGEFRISGSPTDPTPPAIIPCPRCGRQVLLVPQETTE
jgi:DNA-directed RNA polymerase subunit RPC12/RpoP